MIYRLEQDGGALFERLKPCHYSRRIRSHYLAYGTKYWFCSFFVIERGGEAVGIISLFNSSAMLCDMRGEVFTDDELEEISMLLHAYRPCSVELDPQYAARLRGRLSDIYRTDLRTEFAFSPSGKLPELEVDECPPLDDVFAVLASSFPTLAGAYELWITDTSHRVRRGLSQSFMMGGCTTATIQYIVDGTALVGHVATLPEKRGHFYARRLLYWIGERLNADGYEVRLFARPHRVSYYEEIGFAAVAHDVVFELIDADEDGRQK